MSANDNSARHESTANQRRAADPEASAWVSANAGTGKTHVLIDRISRLLLAGAKPERLLCLTFTKAAAAEMANRLNDRLATWARAGDDALAGKLFKLTGTKTAPETLLTARRLFAEVLEAPGGLRIRTIHSFCESLLGRFPLEAGVSPHFSVLDERTAGELLEDARDRLLEMTQRPGSDGVRDALNLLAGLLGEDAFAQTTRELSSRRGRFARLRARAGGTEALIVSAYLALGLAPGESRADALAAASAEGAFDAAALARAVAALRHGSKPDIARADTIALWLKSAPATRAAMFEETYAPLFLKQDGLAKDKKNVITKKAADSTPGARETLLEEQARVAAVSARLGTIGDADATAALLRFGAALLDEYERLKGVHAQLDYDDLILRTVRLLGAEGGVSWVHYKLDGGIDHVLVDEAQDTSPEQWEVIGLIADDFYSGAGVREPGMRTMFAVGDEKQSIYSFQGADPDGFARMRAHFRARAEAADCRWNEVGLTVSYRSVRDVLNAVDGVFAQGPARDGVAMDEAPIIHHTVRKDEFGLVEMWPTVVPDEATDEAPWDDPVDKAGPNDPPVVLAERIAETIKSWCDNGEVLASAGRPLRPDDIMILVRRRGIFMEAMIRALKTRGIAVAGADRMTLLDQLAVMDLVALGRFALLADDDLALAEVLKGPLFGFDDDADLFPIAHGRDGPLWASLRAAAKNGGKWEHAKERLSALLAMADFTPPYEFFAHILGAMGGRRAILARLGHEALDPIDEFLGLALDFERTHTPSLQGFLHWVSRGETEVKRDLEIARPEVRVLTIHGAKGLESPVVFLPDTCTVPSKSKEDRILWGDNAPFWQPAKHELNPVCKALREDVRTATAREYRRLLYVAMTRARDRLYVCGFENKLGRADGCWYDLARTAIESADNVEAVAVPGFGDMGLRMETQTEGARAAAPVAAQPSGKAPALPGWAQQAPPPEPDPGRPLSPARPSAMDAPSVASPFADDDGSRFHRGTLIHRLLEILPAIAPKRRSALLADYLARPVHGIDADAQAEIAAVVLAVLDDAAFAPLFGPGSMAEVPVAGIVGGRVLSARIDRLLVADDHIAIVDYKTNRPPPRTPEDVAPAYLAQMAAYRALLGGVYPERRIDCLLAWTDGPRLMHLPEALLDAHAP